MMKVVLLSILFVSGLLLVAKLQSKSSKKWHK
jgi:hypothetical protein